MCYRAAMPRPRSPPRLYLDPGRRAWVIRDGGAFIRTGIAEADRAAAERRLGEYLAEKHEPERGPDPLIADVLNIYATEHMPHCASTRRSGTYNAISLLNWWGAKRASDVTPQACRAYAAASRSQSMARRDLSLLRAAFNHYRRSTGIAPQATIVLPPKEIPRDRWLTRDEAARLLWAARRFEHLRRFILLALATGSRAGVLFRLQWSQVDLENGLLYRRPRGAREGATKKAPPVRLGRKIVGHLRRWRKLDRSQWIISYDGQPITRFSKSWPAALKRAGLAGTGVTIHSLRHTRATWTVQAGVPIWEVSGFLGMSVATLERVYGHHHPDWQKRAADI
jgi:integrase